MQAIRQRAFPSILLRRLRFGKKSPRSHVKYVHCDGRDGLDGSKNRAVRFKLLIIKTIGRLDGLDGSYSSI
jgi:hypothetical protein